MPAQPDSNVQELLNALAYARKELERIRAAAERNAELAEASSKATQLYREWERSLRDLGQALVEAATAGHLDGVELPSAVKKPLALAQLLAAKRAAQSSSIHDLLAEGVEAADRRAPKKGPPHSPVASVLKKR